MAQARRGGWRDRPASGCGTRHGLGDRRCAAASATARRPGQDLASTGSAPAAAPRQPERAGRGAAGGRRRGPAVHREPAFDPVEAGLESLRGVVGARHQDAGAHQLEQQPWRRGTAELQQRGVDDVGRPGQLRRAESAGLAQQPLGAITRYVEQTRWPRRRAPPRRSPGRAAAGGSPRRTGADPDRTR